VGMVKRRRRRRFILLLLSSVLMVVVESNRCSRGVMVGLLLLAGVCCLVLPSAYEDSNRKYWFIDSSIMLSYLIDDTCRV
jgi:accessory gene regulator protein AgrB